VRVAGFGLIQWSQRDQYDARCFRSYADVAVCRGWMKVSQALDYMAGVHPRFDRDRAEGFLAKTEIRRTKRVRELSKGQWWRKLHLALTMAIDANKAAVLTSPRLGARLLISAAVLRFAG